MTRSSNESRHETHQKQERRARERSRREQKEVVLGCPSVSQSPWILSTSAGPLCCSVGEQRTLLINPHAPANRSARCSPVPCDGETRQTTDSREFRTDKQVQGQQRVKSDVHPPNTRTVKCGSQEERAASADLRRLQYREGTARTSDCSHEGAALH